MPWDSPALWSAPKVYDDPDRSVEGVKAIFYDGMPWKGKPTRVFAYYGLPKVQPGKKVPAMVLVHGGGGSAFIPWVQLWVSRGYAAISMDTCGSISSGGYLNHTQHEFGGPPGWGGFDQVDVPFTDQWTYHAVADVVLAHSLIRSLPQVDADKVGVTGVSWGGYLTCIAAGVDQRFTFAASVYGCGFLGDNSAWVGEFEKMGPKKAEQWLKAWDPSVYLPQVKIPMQWITGTTDFAYPMDSWQKSYRLTKGPRMITLRPYWPHDHGTGEKPEEICAMADALFKNAAPLTKVTASGRDGQNAWATYQGPAPVVQADLTYTTDRGPWQQRKWTWVRANVDNDAQRVSAVLPSEATVYYFNLATDGGRLVVSSEHVEIAAPSPQK